MEHEHDLTTEQGVVAYMSEATTEADWNDRCDVVKEVNDGYPPFWYAVVVMSGLMTRTAKRWNSDAVIRITSLKDGE